ncbi:carboxypeptidase-like regulatory domain-containing protein, partial [Cecembia sp.]|uniref:carboxypeptidase-like regulatory domain-containing protein n=1 Tax=Cecembia sp. TaxID=1898110 RepID=UPI00344DE584
MNFLLIFIATVFCFYPVVGQNLSGEVVDNEGEPLSFASVYVEGTSTGTSTNLQGQFTLN